MRGRQDVVAKEAFYESSSIELLFLKLAFRVNLISVLQRINSPNTKMGTVITAFSQAVCVTKFLNVYEVLRYNSEFFPMVRWEEESISLNNALNQWGASKEKAKYLRTAHGFAAINH